MGPFSMPTRTEADGSLRRYHQARILAVGHMERKAGRTDAGEVGGWDYYTEEVLL